MASIIFPEMDREVRRLDNGLTLALESLPYLHSVAAGLWVRAGSAHESPEECGLAHLLEHLFFRGTASRSAHDLMEAIESRGGQINAFTSREYTCLYVRMLGAHLPVGLEILSDILHNALFCDLEKERNIILEEIASIDDTPDECIHDLHSAFHWPDHPLGRPISGTEASVSALGLDDVRRFFHAWYRPENMILSIAGNFDRDATIARVEALFGAFTGAAPEGAPEATLSAPRFQSGVAEVTRDVAQAHVCVGFPGPTVSQESRYCCNLVSDLLGGGSTSRLFERIREDEGLAYNVYAYRAFHHAAGVLGIYAGVAPRNYDKAVALIGEELRRLRAEGVSGHELNVHREQSKGHLLMALESTFTRMAAMAKSMMYYDRLMPVEEVIDAIDRVTPEDVRRYAVETFTPENSALMALGPGKEYAVEQLAL